MKAIVMAGGEGTRLRPLTEGRPKPMVELLGKPVLWWTLRHLKKYGIEDVCMTLRYLPKKIQDYFSDGAELGMNITYRVEAEPLGTAGSVRACGDFIGGEDVLIISGDAVCNFDLASIIGFHRERGAEVTIALYEHPEPTDFGLVLTDEDGRVTAFSEKPGWEKVVTNRINTGIYILSPKAVEAIPQGREYDFGKELFPKLVREGRGVYACPAGSYWCDIGSPEAYRRCCVDIVGGLAGFDLGVPEQSEGVWSASPLQEVAVTPPVYVGEGCKIEPGARIGPGAVITEGSVIEWNARVTDSVINGAHIGRSCRINGAIVGRGASVERDARIETGAVIGDGSLIGSGCTLAPGVRIWPERTVPEGERVTKSVTADAPARPARFKKDWILSGTVNGSLSPETVVTLGAVLGRHGRVGVAHTGGEGGRLLADAVMCGITSSGGEAVRLDCDFEAETAFAVKLFSLERAVFVRAWDNNAELTFFDSTGVVIGTAERRKLEAALSGERPAHTGKIGGISRAEGTARAFISGVTEELRKYASTRGTAVAVTGTGAENRALRCVLASLGFVIREVGAGTAGFDVTDGGWSFTAVDERGRRIDELHACAVTAISAMRLGESRMAAPSWLPDAAARLGQRFGCAVVGEGDPRWQALYASQRYFRDGVYAAALTAAAMARDNTQLSRLYDDLPGFAVRKERVEIGCSRAEAMRMMAADCAEFALELGTGLNARLDGGLVRLNPDPSRPAITLRAESDTPERAENLLRRYTDRLRRVTGGES